ncbi:MAG TPA: hypothetical protein V6D50_09745 [Chroococcales cyanobacterium]|jgi:hypothetical protein
MKRKNSNRVLAEIPLLSLSILALTVAPAALATTVTRDTPQASQRLIAQQVTCRVVNIQTGQLAVRVSPNGKSRAGLDNGNTVALVRGGSAPWTYVRVIDGPNRTVNGLEGWVNSNYLSCGETSASARGACNVVNIRSGQLALRSTPNGESKAGLNNGNVVRRIKDGSAPWVYVRVLQGPNNRVNGLEGWVNSDYLSCYD